MTPQNSLRQTVSISAFEIRSRFQPPFFARVTHALLSDRTVPSEKYGRVPTVVVVPIRCDKRGSAATLPEALSPSSPLISYNK